MKAMVTFSKQSRAKIRISKVGRRRKIFHVRDLNFLRPSLPPPSLNPVFPETFFFAPEFSSGKAALFPNWMEFNIGVFRMGILGKWNEKSELNIVFAVEKGSDHAPISVSS
ncbi:hypothetical protein CEXT_791491 [Caerostris extrusa]|uniref:Uncharacterized protein n=1 Tax=Caerostris extrusa TaxID=172846 RepID=A0AAV4X956_CAEEX|nr:hypothetical protein CEXT_791491 [Caerostris extrusa]